MFDVCQELAQPTFKHSANFRDLSISEQASSIAISDGAKLTTVLDFSNFSLKMFHSTDKKVELALNKTRVWRSTLLNKNTPDLTFASYYKKFKKETC